MLKFVVLAAVICAANAGLIGGLGLGHGAVVAAPAVAVAHAPLAASYQNNNLLSLHPTPVVAAPVAVAHAPVALGIGGLGLGHGLLH